MRDKPEALLIVDIQNDFLPGGALAVPKGNEVIPIINSLQTIFSFVIATKDWHPPKHVSFASTHGKRPGESIEVQGIKQELWPDHCVQGSVGAEFSPALHTDKIRRVFYKGINPAIDDYSDFYDNAHIQSTGVGEYLQSEGIETIYFAGLTTEYCVKYSVLDAIKFFGFKTYVILDACRGIELHPGDVANAVDEMRKAGVKIIQSSDLLAQLTQS